MPYMSSPDLKPRRNWLERATVNSRFVVSFLAVAGVVAGVAVVALGQQPASTNFAELANAGRAVYQAQRVSCHLPDLRGRNSPPLVGSVFLSARRDRTTADLVN